MAKTKRTAVRRKKTTRKITRKRAKRTGTARKPERAKRQRKPPSQRRPPKASTKGRASPLGRAVGALPPLQRAALVHRYVLDLPYAEVAEALGCSEEAARASAYEGRRKLRADAGGR